MFSSSLSPAVESAVVDASDKALGDKELRGDASKMHGALEA
jgi:hypothetical protein